MLEKAGWALARLSSHGEMPNGEIVETADYFITQARAVLMAIRDADEGHYTKWADDIWDGGVPYSPCSPIESFRNTIDSILQEKPE